MRRLAITLAVITTLGLAATALAALPAKGPFAGKTSLHPINGFPDLVTFRTSAKGLALTKFQFGTLGCFGTGSFPVGTDPYGDPTAVATIKSIPVTTKGTFLFTAKPVLPDAGATITTTVIKGTFSSTKSVSGTIAVTQTDNGDKCTSTMKFTAVPGTPSSLGFD
ncbi:MAG TPA: hypothetical protein VGM80_00940 [Gaiellaceae bacterium]